SPPTADMLIIWNQVKVVRLGPPTSTLSQKLNLFVLRIYFSGEEIVIECKLTRSEGESTSYVVGFFHKLPEKVTLRWDIVPVKPYIPRPTRCFKCLKNRHSARPQRTCGRLARLLDMGPRLRDRRKEMSSMWLSALVLQPGVSQIVGWN
ncbi:hypothetical protein Hamer_G005323, partial [Homarus americanus]